MNGFKGFLKDFSCNGFKFRVGEKYEIPDDKIKLCEKGFHFCENGLDVLSYYEPTGRFAEVEGEGKTEKATDDSKVVCSKIHIKTEISLNALIGAGVKFILDKVDWKNAKESNTGNSSAATNTGYRSAATNTGHRSAATNTGHRSAATNTGDSSAATNTGNSSAATNTGDSSAATNTGNSSAATNTGNSSAATNTGYSSAATNTGHRSAATNTGDSSAATNTGYRSAAEVSGKQSVACGFGIDNKARGKKGCWLVLSEWKETENEWVLVNVKSIKVDGKKIKEDEWYMLKNGKFVIEK